MGVRSTIPQRVTAFTLLALAAAAVAIELARPVRAAAIAFDSQVAVLHFQRIVSGQHLETFVPTTPKPLLTLLYGVLYDVFGDWRPLSWATIAAYVLGVLLAARLVDRIAGPAAGAFAGVAVLLCPSLLFDVGYALATPWALLGWLGAGLALTRTRPRWSVAGLCLAMATLARFETVVVVGVAALVVAWATLAPVRLVPGGRLERRAWLLPLVALLAIPVMLVHDWRLTGDPLFWTTVARHYTQATTIHVLTPLETVGFLANRYQPLIALVLLALIGVIQAWRTGARAVVLGLIALGPGIAAFLVLLAVAHVFVSDRYAAGIDVAVAVGAGLGLPVLLDALRRFWTMGAERSDGPTAIAQVAAAAALAVVIAGPYWIVDDGLRTIVRRAQRLAADADRAAPLIRSSFASAPGPSDGVWAFVPGPVRPGMAVMTGLPLTRVAGTDASKLDVARGVPGPGQLLFHSAAGDGAAGAYAAFEIDGPRTAAGVTLDPLLADPARGVWVVRTR